jgi:hypothetical protein
MGTATLEVSGAEAARAAAELRAALAANAGPGDSVSPVEVHRSAEMVVAVIGLVFAGVDTAKTIWDWWQSRRRPEGTTVKILLADGTQLDVSTVRQDQLEIVFRQAGQQQD